MVKNISYNESIEYLVTHLPTANLSTNDRGFARHLSKESFKSGRDEVLNGKKDNRMMQLIISHNYRVARECLSKLELSEEATTIMDYVMVFGYEKGKRSFDKREKSEIEKQCEKLINSLGGKIDPEKIKI